jgi:rubrerythrin
MDGDDLRAKIRAGQAATATALRGLANHIESLPLSDAAEVMDWLAPHIDQLRREAERIFRAQPSRS